MEDGKDLFTITIKDGGLYAKPKGSTASPIFFKKISDTEYKRNDLINAYEIITIISKDKIETRSYGDFPLKYQNGKTQMFLYRVK